MAIDHTSLGGYPIFPLEINWKTNPTINLYPQKQIIGFPGTSQDILPIMGAIPLDFQVSVLLDTKANEKIMFDFFDTCKGRWKKFWMKLPQLHYELYATILSSSSTIDILSNDFDRSFKGNERIWLYNFNGNSCIKKIISYVKYVSPNRIRLTTESAITDMWTLGDYRISLGQLKLVRFDQDELEVNYTTDIVSEITLKMKELVYDYAEMP